MKNKILFVVSFVVMIQFLIVAQVDAAVVPGSVCGNSICEFGETSSSCPFDCNPCGDGTCDASIGENPITCSADCSGPVCGDGTCASSESYETCPLDCTAPPVSEPDPGTPSPSCEDVTIHVGEKTTCSIKVENIETFPLTQVVAQVTIPDKITKVNNTDSWSCMSTSGGVKCQKAYSPYLTVGEIEYLELTLTTDTEGRYSLAASIVGSGEQYRRVTYNTAETITVTDSTPAATADAVDDYAGCNTSVNLANNDDLCSFGTTTFAYHDVTKGVTITNFNTNTGNVSFSFDDGMIMGTLFSYDILCDNVVTDTARLIYNCS